MCKYTTNLNIFSFSLWNELYRMNCMPTLTIWNIILTCSSILLHPSSIESLFGFNNWTNLTLANLICIKRMKGPQLMFWSCVCVCVVCIRMFVWECVQSFVCVCMCVPACLCMYFSVMVDLYVRVQAYVYSCVTVWQPMRVTVMVNQ